MKKARIVLTAACALVFCFAIAGCGGGSGSGGGSDSGGDSGASSSSNSSGNSGLNSGSSNPGNSGLNGGSGGSGLGGSGSTSSGGDEQFDTFADECLDANGNPTLYAFTELKGWQLETLVQQQGYEWDYDLEAWVGPNGTFFDAFDENGWLDDEEIANLDKAGAGTECGYMFCYAGFATVKDCFDSISPMVVVDSEQLDSESLVAVVHGPSMVEVPVLMKYDTGYDLVSVLVYSPDAIQSGFITEDLSLGTEIRSLDDFWVYYTGEHLND